jgi:Flp pilus assembly protein TadB
VFAALDWAAAQDFGTALLIGMVLGVEREKRIADDGHGIAGLRSFVLFAQAGAVAGYLAKVLAMPWIVPSVVIAVAAVLLAGYLASARIAPKSLRSGSALPRRTMSIGP